MKRLLLCLGLFLGALLLSHGRAHAACAASYPYTFTNGTTADATQVMSNFTDVRSCATSVDNTQIGVLGIYASQILPTTAAQATFGGALAYTFPVGIIVKNTSVGAVPVVINAIAGQTADITQWQVNGVTKSGVNASGVIYSGSGVSVTSGNITNSNGYYIGNTTFSGNAGSVVVQNQASTGHILLVNSSGAANVDIANNGAAVFANSIKSAGPTQESIFFPNASTNAGSSHFTSFGSISNTVAGVTGNLLAVSDNGCCTQVAVDYAGEVGARSFASTGTIQGADAASGTVTYHPPVYTNSGAAVASTEHITRVTIHLSGPATCGVYTGSVYCGSATLTGPAAFASGGTCASSCTGAAPSFTCGGGWMYSGNSGWWQAAISTSAYNMGGGSPGPITLNMQASNPNVIYAAATSSVLDQNYITFNCEGT